VNSITTNLTCLFFFFWTPMEIKHKLHFLFLVQVSLYITLSLKPWNFEFNSIQIMIYTIMLLRSPILTKYISWSWPNFYSPPRSWLIHKTLLHLKLFTITNYIILLLFFLFFFFRIIIHTLIIHYSPNGKHFDFFFLTTRNS